MDERQKKMLLDGNSKAGTCTQPRRPTRCASLAAASMSAQEPTCSMTELQTMRSKAPSSNYDKSRASPREECKRSLQSLLFGWQTIVGPGEVDKADFAFRARIIGN